MRLVPFTKPTILKGFIFIAEKGPQPSSLWKCGNPCCVRVSKRRGIMVGNFRLAIAKSSPARVHSEVADSAHPKAAVDHGP
jgi:hypothetical protein